MEGSLSIVNCKTKRVWYNQSSVAEIYGWKFSYTSQVKWSKEQALEVGVKIRRKKRGHGKSQGAKTKKTRSEELNALVFSYKTVVSGTCFLCIGIGRHLPISSSHFSLINENLIKKKNQQLMNELKILACCVPIFFYR